MRKTIFKYAAFIFSTLKIYQTPVKRKIYKKSFKLIQRLRRRNGEKQSGTKAKELSAGLNQYLLEIRQEGYCLIPPLNASRLLADHQETVTRARSLISLQVSNIGASPSKSYLHRLDKIPENDLAFFYKYFTNPVYLEIAESYLQDEPLLSELKLLVSPVLSMAQPEGSQLWHSDFDDDANLKIFIFLDDIDELTGPLQAINRSQSKDYMKAWNYKWGKEGVSHNDLIVPKSESKSIKTFVGETASVCLIDTVACLHRGSRFPSRERKILYATFNTRTSYRFPPLNWIGLAPKLNSLSSPLLRLDSERRFLNQSGLND